MLRDTPPPQAVNTPNFAQEIAAKDELIQALQNNLKDKETIIRDRANSIKTLKAQLSDLKKA